MTYEHSAGAVVFTVADDNIKYVIIKSRQGYFGFPKGHIERGEDEKTAALREVYEEVGLCVELLDGFRIEDEHPIPSKRNVMKNIVYFAAEYSGQDIKYQRKELSGAQLMTFDEAMSSFQFEGSKRILTRANEFIINYVSKGSKI